MSLLAAGLVALTEAPIAGAVETYAMPSSGSISVQGHGNGHGHGLSQYGARGAAIAGHSAAYIVNFYYPGTTRVALSSPGNVRVRISNTGLTTMVAPSPGLSLTGIGALATTGVTRFRLVAPSGVTTLRLDKLVNSTWYPVKSGVANGAEFSRSAGNIRVYLPDGSSTVFRGVVRAIRGGTGVITINRVPLDGYTAGVVPREMPASWQAAAVQAQSIAARSYGRNAIENNAAQPYDICDNTRCQVYGGMTRYDAAGHTLWTEDLAALTGNNNTVLQYGGHTIFAQYSASNGGWTVAGGQPYLIAEQDPYDNSGTGDPYLNWTRSVPVSSIASYYGLSRVTAILITSRDGHGDWGGRVLSAYVDGVDSGGTSRRITTTGFGIQSAMGLPHNWFKIATTATALPIGHLDAVYPVSPGVLEAAGWSFDRNHIDRPGLVALKIDGVLGTMQTTNISRPDVKTVYNLTTDLVGFRIQVKVARGVHTVCLYAQDQDGLGVVEIKCLSVTMPDPIGHLDLTATGAKSIRVAGWSLDPDHKDKPALVQLVLDGVAQPVKATTVSRPDVQKVYATTTDVLGFDMTTAATSGAHTICVLGVDQDGQGSVPLRCASVTVA